MVHQLTVNYLLWQQLPQVNESTLIVFSAIFHWSSLVSVDSVILCFFFLSFVFFIELKSRDFHFLDIHPHLRVATYAPAGLMWYLLKLKCFAKFGGRRHDHLFILIDTIFLQVDKRILTILYCD